MDTDFDTAGEISETGDALSAFDAPEISPEEYADHWASMLARVLSATKLVEKIIEVKSGVGQAHVMCRVKKSKERMLLEKVIDPILRFLDKTDDCNGFIGKQFILKDGIVKYAWVISVASNNLKEAVSQLCRSFEAAVPKLEVTEAPLLGPAPPQSGGYKSGRRGAAPVAS